MLSRLAWRGVGGKDEDGEQEPESRDRRDSRRCMICFEGVRSCFYRNHEPHRARSRAKRRTGRN